MKRFRAVWSSAAKRAALGATVGAALAATFVATSCNDYGNTFQVPTGAAINFLAPSDANAGGPQFTLTVSSTGLNGGGFVPQTVVQWNGATIPTTYVSANKVTATVAPALIAKAGTAFVNTLQPHSGSGTNGLSNVLTFTINPTPNPIPVVSSMTPTSATAGAAGFTLTINGSAFLPTSDPSGGSQVHWNVGPTQSTLSATNITSTQITASVDANLLVNATSSPVTAIVTVYNPPAPPSTSNGGVTNPSSGGGGTSANGLSFTINPAGTSSTVARSAAEETPAVSADGRYVAYTAAGPNDHSQVFVRDTCEGAAAGCQSRSVLISVAADGTAGGNDSRSPSISADGRYVAFSSAATNLVTGAPAGRQIYLRDTCFGAAGGSCTATTQLVSSDADGALVGTEGILPSLSASGRFVAFLAVTPSHAGTSTAKSAATKSAASDAATDSGYRQVFVRDTCLGASNCTPKTTRISLQPGSDASPSTSNAKPAGPALSAKSNRVAISGATSATLFTRSVAVDDRVFLALTDQ